MTKLTATRVATLPPGTYTDPGQAGLQLRVHQKRNGTSRTWLLRFKFRGEETRILLGHVPQMTLDAARGEARRLRELASQGIDPRRSSTRRRPTATPVTLSAAATHTSHSIEHLTAEFVERYLRPHRKRPEYVEAILARTVLTEWKGRDVRTIKPREVIELLDGITDRGRRVMANRTASVLGQLFKFAVHRNLIEATPVQLLMKPGGKEKPRERALGDDELRAFLKAPLACTRFERLAHVIKVLLLTAARRGELAAAKWTDVNLKAKTWTIPAETAKTGKARVVPLSAWAVDEFKALRKLAERSMWVLPAADGDGHVDAKLLTRGVAKNLERFEEQGVAAFHLHDLRRTARTGLSALKVEPHVAERVLGHAVPGMAGVYDVHAYEDEQREALDKWARHLRSLVSAPSA
jgi:integrase